MLIDQRIVSARHYPLLDADGTSWKLEGTSGSAERWHMWWTVDGADAVADGEGALDASGIAPLWAKKLAQDGGWERLEHGPRTAAAASRWRFEDGAGRGWSGRVRVSPSGDGRFAVELEVERAPSAAAPRVTGSAR